MKCISIKQPWAALIAAGIKTIENRTWKTNYRGQILIHAGKIPDIHALRTPEVSRALMDNTPEKHVYNQLNSVFGAIIGVAELKMCTVLEANLSETDLMWAEEPSLHGKCNYWWILRTAKFFRQPIPYRGRFGLFNVPDEIVRKQLESLQTTDQRIKNDG